MSVILITGTSSGIGRAAAELLARHQHTVYATMRSPERFPDLKQLASSENLPLTILPLDVNDDSSVDAAVDSILTKEKQIDILINNAGVGAFGPVEELSMETIARDMQTNYFGTVRCVKAVLPAMRQRKSGCIINVTSVAGKLYANFHSSYCASKAATEAFSECLAQEMKPFNVRVAMVEPGVIETPIFGKGNELVRNKTNYHNMKRFISMFAASLENHVHPSVVANVILDIVEGRSTSLRNPAGPDALPLLDWRASASDEDYINSVLVDDETWIHAMEERGLTVRKYMEEEAAHQF
jgi:NAD(P)-dependent dehydrogenase (short-subunit alcohol dehydrogenase family)